MLHLDEVIGQGGFGTVYRGRMKSADGLVRRVAVKVLSERMSSDTRAVARFRDEARLLALVDHPGLVPVYALERIDERWAVVMGFVDGVELYEALRQGPLPLGAVRDVGVQVAGVLEALWSHPHPETGEPLRVVHRDIKPHNLMVSGDGRVRVLDLGVASARFEARETATQAGEVAGTLAYMSPQRWARRDDQHAGDLYALGATLYQLITGEVPLGAGPSEEEHNHQLDAMFVDLPDDFALILRGLMAWSDIVRPSTQVLKQQLSALDLRDSTSLADWASSRTHQSFSDLDRDHTSAPSMLGAHAIKTDQTLDSGRFLDLPANATPATDFDGATVVRPEPPKGRKIWPWLVLMAGFSFVATLFLGATGLTGFTLWRSANRGPAVHVVLAPSVRAEVLLAEHEPIRTYLEAKLNRPVLFHVGDSYEDTSRQLTDGTAAFALMPHRLGTTAKEADPSLTVLATKVVDGSNSVDGYLLTRRDVEATTIGDLVGHTVCYSDKLSNTGYKLPRGHITAAGLSPDDDFVTRISGDHERVLIDLIAGDCDAGGTFSWNYNTASQRDISVAQLRILAMTGNIPHDSFWAGPTADVELVRTFASALIEFDPSRDVGTDVVGYSERISGFAEPAF